MSLNVIINTGDCCSLTAVLLHSTLQLERRKGNNKKESNEVIYAEDRTFDDREVW